MVIENLVTNENNKVEIVVELRAIMIFWLSREFFSAQIKMNEKERKKIQDCSSSLHISATLCTVIRLYIIIDDS